MPRVPRLRNTLFKQATFFTHPLTYCRGPGRPVPWARLAWSSLPEVSGNFHLYLLELEAALPTLPAWELSLLTCPMPWTPVATIPLPTLPFLGSPSLGTVQAAGPEALGTFLTSALVSSGSWQLPAGFGMRAPEPTCSSAPLFPRPSVSGLLPLCNLPWEALLVPSSPSGLLRGRR